MKRAIVLGGGGSRGAYELGVWRALREEKIDYQIVTGASIGAINGALMATNDYEIAEALWSTITVGDIMKDGINLEYSIEAMFRQKNQLLPFLRRYVNSKGADISPLRNLIEKAIEEAQLRSSSCKFGMVTLQIPTLKPLEMTKSQIPTGKLHDYLIASASCFPAFPLCKIDEKSYIDGGYYDNLPIDFALKLGADTIIAVDLNFNDPTHPKYTSMPNITYIQPSWHPGSFLDFNQKQMERNATLGYNDAKKILGAYDGFRYTFQKIPQNQSNRFLHMVQNFEANIASDNGILRFSEKLESPLTSCIREFTRAPLTYSDFNLRGAEVTAELLEIDPLPIYDMDTLGRTMLERITPSVNVVDIMGIIKKSPTLTSARGIGKNFEPKTLLSGIVKQMQNSKNIYEDFKWLSAAMPRVLTAAIYLQSIQ